MDAVLDSLAQLLLKALPTFILLILFHLYLKVVFYRPLDKLLKERYDATEGARKAADESLAKAEQKAAEYEQALREARAELFTEQEEARHRLHQRQATALSDARAATGKRVRAAKAELAQEVEAARRGLDGESEALANEIVAALLERKAS